MRATDVLKTQTIINNGGYLIRIGINPKLLSKLNLFSLKGSGLLMIIIVYIYLIHLCISF